MVEKEIIKLFRRTWAKGKEPNLLALNESLSSYAVITGTRNVMKRHQRPVVVWFISLQQSHISLTFRSCSITASDIIKLVPKLRIYIH